MPPPPPRVLTLFQFLILYDLFFLFRFALSPTEQAAEDSKREAELKALSERKRRALLRWQDKGFQDDANDGVSEKEAENFEDKEEEDVTEDEEELEDDQECQDVASEQDDFVKTDGLNTSDSVKNLDSSAIGTSEDCGGSHHKPFTSLGESTKESNTESCQNALTSDAVGEASSIQVDAVVGSEIS